MAKRMAEQMELFEPVERGFDEGGLMDEGGTVDPVSGNDVPSGSTKEEVRDDIPAQLSEGEFVFPADVVRYIGLEKLMMMRQEAKMGLAAMEAMGQMGNSEEATMPDDLPFDMYDLDIEDDNEYNMAQGGVVKMQQGGTNYTPPTTGGYVAPPPVTTGFSGPPPVQPFQSGQTQFKVAGAGEGAVTPKTAVDPVVPTFSDFVGQNIPGVDFTMVTFYDENGQAKVLKKFPDGSFEDPANPGTKVTPADMGLTEEIKTETTPTQQRVETAKVVDQDDKDPGSTQTQLAWGGKPDLKNPGLKTDVTMVDFSVLEMPGSLPGTLGAVAGSAQALMGKDYPDDAKLGISIDGVTTVVSGTAFNQAKKAGYMGDLSDGILSRATANAAVAGQLISKYGVSKNPFGNKTMDDFISDASKSTKGIAELAEAYGIDLETIEESGFPGFKSKHKGVLDAIAKATGQSQEDIQNKHEATVYGGAVADSIGEEATGGYDDISRMEDAKAAAQEYANFKDDVPDGGRPASSFSGPTSKDDPEAKAFEGFMGTGDEG